MFIMSWVKIAEFICDSVRGDGINKMSKPKGNANHRKKQFRRKRCIVILLMFVKYEFSWISWVGRSTNFKLQRNMFLKSTIHNYTNMLFYITCMHEVFFSHIKIVIPVQFCVYFISFVISSLNYFVLFSLNYYVFISLNCFVLFSLNYFVNFTGANQRSFAAE